LVSLPTWAFASHVEMQATSQVGKEARTAIGDNLESVLYGIDVGLNRKRAQSTTRESYVDKTDEEIDSMRVDELHNYAKFCRSGWK
jgi:hypothetical protein